MRTPLVLAAFLATVGCASTPERELRPPTIVAVPSGAVNAFVIHDGEDAVIVDCTDGDAGAAAVVRELRAAGVQPSLVILTHADREHVAGLSTLLAVYPDARVGVARPEIRAALEAAYPGGLPHLARVEVLASRELELAGGARIRLDSRWAPAESEYTTTVEVPALRAVLVGDLAFHRVHPNCRPTLTQQDFARWTLALTALEARYPDWRVYPGRGPAPTHAAVFAASRRYLDDFQTAVRDSARRADAVRTLQARYGDWLGAEDVLVASLAARLRE